MDFLTKKIWTKCKSGTSISDQIFFFVKERGGLYMGRESPYGRLNPQKKSICQPSNSLQQKIAARKARRELLQKCTNERKCSLVTDPVPPNTLHSSTSQLVNSGRRNSILTTFFSSLALLHSLRLNLKCRVLCKKQLQFNHENIFPSPFFATGSFRGRFDWIPDRHLDYLVLCCCF